MAQVDVIRNGIIDKLLAISDKDYLMALLRLVDNSAVEDEKIKLTKEQKLMLEMSKADIQNGRTISQNDLDKNDLEWLKGKQSGLKRLKQRREILKYWTERNESTIYAKKLIEITAKHLKVISKNPEAFKETEIDDVRESAMGHFSLYYKITPDQIIVMAFWDNRQDLKKLLKAIT